jgi:hypothetical protein
MRVCDGDNADVVVDDDDANACLLHGNTRLNTIPYRLPTYLTLLQVALNIGTVQLREINKKMQKRCKTL